MKIKHIVLFFVILALTTGCSATDKFLVDSSDKIIKYEVTGQSLEKRLLCKPSEDSEIYQIYLEHEDQMSVKLEDLPKCEDFNLKQNKVDSLWIEGFIKPTAWLILKIGYWVGNLGLGLIIVGILIRLVLLPIQFKSTKQSFNMRKANPEIQKLEKKYKGRKDNEAMMAKSQETMLIYKKYKVNPMLGCLLAFIQLPIFLAFLQAIYRLPVLYEEHFLTLNLGMTPLKGITDGNYIYLLLIILILFSTFFSFKYSMSQTPTMNENMQKQTKTMLYVMMVVIGFASFSLPTAIAIYWVTTNLFIVIQTFLTNFILGEKEEKPKKGIKEKLKEKEGMKYGKNNK